MVGFGGAAFGQALTGQWDAKGLAAATLVGAASGALAPIVATGAVVAVLLGTASNAAQTLLTNYANVPAHITAIPHVYELMTAQAGHAFALNHAPVLSPIGNSARD